MPYSVQRYCIEINKISCSCYFFHLDPAYCTFTAWTSAGRSSWHNDGVLCPHLTLVWLAAYKSCQYTIVLLPYPTKNWSESRWKVLYCTVYCFFFSFSLERKIIDINDPCRGYCYLLYKCTLFARICNCIVSV
jgi:hypothetical protein